MRPLSLLVLLLFAVVVRKAELSSAQAPSGTPTLVQELLAIGTRLRFKSFNNLYLTFDLSSKYYWALPRQDSFQDWTIERITDQVVVIKSNTGHYLEHGTSDWAKGAGKEELAGYLIPVKNPNGSWSFMSLWNKWLSAHTKYEPQRFAVNFEKENKACEHWFLEPYTPPANPLLEELLANGAPQRFKSFNELYLTDEPGSAYFWTKPRQDWGRLQKWTIVQINDHEVAIKSNNNYYIGHGTGHWANEARAADEWEILTPVKNDDGTWSFKSRWNYWLSAHSYDGPDRYYISFEPKNSKCERWKLEQYTPPATKTLMEELLADGAPRALKTFDGNYVRLERSATKTHVFARPEFRPYPWSIEQINENEVAIKTHDGRYIQHARTFIRTFTDLSPYANEWEMLTPVKNVDGTWSFKSRYDKWLSSARPRVGFMPENKKCEHWTLEPYFS